MTSLARPVAVAGVGYSKVDRGGAASSRALTFTAGRAALADAGLQAADIDGIFEYKFGPESPGCQEAARLLGVPDLAAFADIMGTGPSGLAGPLVGVMAVASGACETVLTYRCITREAGYMGGVTGGASRVGGREQFLTPYGYLAGIIMNMALKKRRWLTEFNRGEEDFGEIVLNSRRWSALNPRAALRDPLTMDDYLASRMVVDPLRLLDCDYPVNGAVATIITTAERARDLRQPVVLVDAMSFGTGGQADWLFGDDYLYGGTVTCSQRLWSRSSVTISDVDVAELYDGFTLITGTWIESLGFCGRGEFGDWVDNGRRIGPGGSLPLNTSGGQLSEGRLHGVSFLAEAVTQLRGQCGKRQVDGAQVALVASGLYPQCGAMVLVTG